MLLDSISMQKLIKKLLAVFPIIKIIFKEIITNLWIIQLIVFTDFSSDLFSYVVNVLLTVLS